jgi:hypothetical protein
MRLDGIFTSIDNSSTISKIALAAILGTALCAVIAVALRFFGSKNDGQAPSNHTLSSPPAEQPKPLSERKIIFWYGDIRDGDEMITQEICQNLQDRIPNVQVETREFLTIDASDQNALCLYLNVELANERHFVYDTKAKEAIKVAKGNCVWICSSENVPRNEYFPDAPIAMSGINSVKSQDDNIVINCKYNVNYKEKYKKSFSDQNKLIGEIVKIVQKMGWPTK